MRATAIFIVAGIQLLVFIVLWLAVTVKGFELRDYFTNKTTKI